MEKLHVTKRIWKERERERKKKKKKKKRERKKKKKKKGATQRAMKNKTTLIIKKTKVEEDLKQNP